MRILVVGGSGMLGMDVVSVLGASHEVLSPSSSELDITDPASIGAIPAGVFGQLDWCINCAAYTAVDKAETEVQQATELNALGPGYLARACAMAGCKFIHISTDFVFDGSSTEPYTEDSPTNPLGVYGKTKRQGELAVQEANPNAIILRTSWLYGPSGVSFPRTMIRAFEAGKQLRVVSDQIGKPTYTEALATTIAEVIDRNLFPGIYHAAGPDDMTWYDFAKLTLETWSGKPAQIEAIQTSDWPTPAQRPPFSVLSTKKIESLGISSMSPARESIAEFCKRLRTTEEVRP